jgi:hypothetical protein
MRHLTGSRRSTAARAARCRHALLAATLLALPALASGASRLPERFTAHFDVEVAGQSVGGAECRVAPDSGQRSRLECVTRPQGLFSAILPAERVDRSLWEYDAGGRPRPLRYETETSGRWPRSARIEFDWSRGKARSYEKRSETRQWSVRVTAGTLDPILYMLALMQDLTAGRRDLAYSVAERGKVKTIELRPAGTEVITTGLGRLETVRLRRVSEKGRKTTVWCAVGLYHLPAQVEHEEPGAPKLLLRLKASEGLATP